MEGTHYWEIFERVCPLPDSDEPTLYAFSAAVYDAWAEGTALERSLASRLVKSWAGSLQAELWENYRCTKHAPRRPVFEDFADQWKRGRGGQFHDHRGLLSALERLATTE
jgi:hypothetical protein